MNSESQPSTAIDIPRAPAIGLVVVLLAVHCCLAVSSIRSKSATYDEIIHVTAGYAYWVDGDFRFQPENGNLPQRLAALPLLWMDLSFPRVSGDVWHTGHAFFFKSGNDPDAMLFAGRVMIVLLSLALGGVVYAWSARVFGRIGGLISLVLYTFSPTMLAHGRLTTSDMAATLFFILSLRAIWAVLHRIDVLTLAAAAAAVAGLLLSKMSGVLIVPVSALMVLTRLMWGRGCTLALGRARFIAGRGGQALAYAGAAAAVAAVSVVIVWGAYQWRFSAAPDVGEPPAPSYSTWTAQLDGAGRLAPVIRGMRDARLLPEAYLFGFSYVLSQARIRPAFLNGQYATDGWWYFFPYCIAVKTPLVTLMAIVLGIAALVRWGRRQMWIALSPLLFFAVVYGLSAITATINIGHRHVLPLYPVLFILAGAAGLWWRGARPVFTAAVPLVLVVFLLETLTIWPHYLAFFNAAAGGPRNGYRHLVDSSLDWGQDLIGAVRYIDAHRSRYGPGHRYYMAYFGAPSPIYYGLDAEIIITRKMPWTAEVTRQASELGAGTYLISATEFQQVYGMNGEWNRTFDNTYWFARNVVRDYLASENDPAARQRLVSRWGSENMLEWILWQFVRLRFARLCRYLQRRPPDDTIGYSILVYEVSGEELATALWGTLETIEGPDDAPGKQTPPNSTHP